MATARKTNDTSSFDFDAWLGNASRPEREVVLYGANALQADIERLEREKTDLVTQPPVGVASGSWGVPDGDHGDTLPADVAAKVDAVEKKITALRKQLAASGVTFRVRSVDSDDLSEINVKHPMPKGADDDTRNRVQNDRFMEQLSRQVVAPREFTVEELVALRKGIGEVEFLKLFNKAMECMSETAASTPFWRGSFGETRS